MVRACMIVLMVWALPAFGQPAPPDYGFEFVTVGAPGNSAYVGDLFDEDHFRGRGAVNYEYRISRTEIRTSDWLEFVNTAREFQVPLDTAFGANTWGAGLGIDPKTGWEMYFQFTEESGDWPVAGISWWAAATYCNWLHNGKALSQEAFLDGAYDISTFGRDPVTLEYTDQTTHSPDARFWIPTTDEWVKAAHWDPHRYGPGQGGYWEFDTSSDTQPVPGLPGVGETSADMDIEDEEAFLIPLESYPETRSPWGLLDLSGGGAEWTEEWSMPNGTPEFKMRIWQGAGGGYTTISPGEDNYDDILGIDRTTDRIWEIGGTRPDLTFNVLSFRVASAVPAPGVGAPCLVFGLFASGRPRRA